ncbi:MAG: FtsQ-type POTRA domain-containing protein [Candidatus Omnitrophica bacterium]|nr:FtsQ-type POTRA domain-containing protein [Candidatus Omnitrophota bacterium]
MAKRSIAKIKSSNARSTKKIFSAIKNFVVKQIGCIVIVVIIMYCMVMIKNYAQSNPLFKITTIDVNKTHFVTRANILTSAHVKKGDNIFKINLKNVARRLEKIPRIKKAEIARLLPNTIRMVITERYEVAQVKIPFHKEYYLIDEEGHILTPILTKPGRDVLIINAQFTQKSEFAAGEVFDNAPLKKVLKLIKRMQTSAVLKNEKDISITIDNREDMTIVLPPSLEIRIGKNTEAIFEKQDMLREILNDPNRDSIRYIDMRFNDVVVKRR